MIVFVLLLACSTVAAKNSRYNTDVGYSPADCKCWSVINPRTLRRMMAGSRTIPRRVLTAFAQPSFCMSNWGLSHAALDIFRREDWQKTARGYHSAGMVRSWCQPGLLQCHLYDTKPLVDICPAEVAVSTLLCALRTSQLKRTYAQLSVIGGRSMMSEPHAQLDLALDIFAVVSHCLDESEWPFTMQQIYQNYARVVNRNGLEWPRPMTFYINHKSPSNLRCPEDVPEPVKLAEPTDTPRVSCLFALTLPAEAELAETVLRTWGQRCSRISFYILDGRGTYGKLPANASEALQKNVKDLFEVYRDAFPPLERLLLRDPSTKPKTAEQKHKALHSNSIIIKVLLMFHRIYMEDLHTGNSTDWFCKVDPDSLFLVDNLRLLIRTKNISTSKPWFLSKMAYFWKALFGPFPDAGPGVCINKAALNLLGEDLTASVALRMDRMRKNLTLATLAPRQDLRRAALGDGVGHVSYDCDFLRGWGEDVVLANCFTKLGVKLHPIVFADPLGRSYFNDEKFLCQDHNYAAFSLTTPLGGGAYSLLTSVWRDSGDLWRFLPCRPAIPPIGWLMPYALGAHRYKEPKQLSDAWEDLKSGGEQCRRNSEVAGAWNPMRELLHKDALRCGREHEAEAPARSPQHRVRATELLHSWRYDLAFKLALASFLAKRHISKVPRAIVAAYFACVAAEKGEKAWLPILIWHQEQRSSKPMPDDLVPQAAWQHLGNFSMLLQRMKRFGFRREDAMPVRNWIQTGSWRRVLYWINDGAHRTSSAIVLGLKVTLVTCLLTCRPQLPKCASDWTNAFRKTSSDPLIYAWDRAYFLNRGVLEPQADLALYHGVVRVDENIHMLHLWPGGIEDLAQSEGAPNDIEPHEWIGQLLREWLGDSAVWYTKIVHLSTNAFLHYAKHAYGSEDWLQWKIPQILRQNLPFVVIWFQAPLKVARELRDRIRTMVYPDKGSRWFDVCHVTDTREQAQLLSQLLLFDHSMHMLQCATALDSCERASRSLAAAVRPSPSEPVPGVPLHDEDLAVEGSAVLEFYGIRKRREPELDLVFERGSAAATAMKASCGEHEACHGVSFDDHSPDSVWFQFHDKPIEDLLYSPWNVGYCYGLKFIALPRLLEYKLKRGQHTVYGQSFEKDLADADSIVNLKCSIG
eukprot:TRINITY_DN18843_c0_g1_i1.p1 TRINITY_DN18843_c0_g1~~TRINITY_DN18843_c0_g1_i1.p1  ORF type:complete len:1143 (-),score=152.66 TRINITY_DN18843_c0_g1_i1:909-4337(-)